MTLDLLHALALGIAFTVGMGVGGMLFLYCTPSLRRQSRSAADDHRQYCNRTEALMTRNCEAQERQADALATIARYADSKMKP